MLIVTNTDDFGRMPGDTFTVKHVVLPSSRRSEAEFDRALEALETVGLITRYVVADAVYLQVDKFDEHQPNLHKRAEKSKFPENSGNARKVRPNLTESNLTEFKRREPNRSASGARCDDFEQFWAAYPKKKAKEAARKAWEQHRPDAGLVERILAAIAVQRQSLDWQKDGGRFIPFPATWLHRGQWSDEPAPGEAPRDWTCRHEPRCPVGTSAFRCNQRSLLEAGKNA